MFSIKIVLALTLLISSEGIDLNAQSTNPMLDKKHAAIVPIAAFTAKGDLLQLRSALHEGLDAGLSVAEIKEVLVQLYAYTGFPRSLNALNAFMAVLEERKARGIHDDAGKAPQPLPTGQPRLALGAEIQTKLVGQPVKGAVYEFSPEIDLFLKEHLFADIFGRDNLDFKSREIATIAALAALGGTEPQLHSHLNVGLYNGISKSEMQHLTAVLRSKVGAKESDAVNDLFEAIVLRKSDRATPIPANDHREVVVEKVAFPNRMVPKSDLNIVGNLFFPADFDKNKKYPAIIVGHPASGVKEQTAGLYARKLAEQGFVTLAFDASYQGESGGEPRFLEDPSVRVEDFSAATDFLSRHTAVDAGKIGVLGICAGGGYAIKAAQTEHRIKAVATVSMVDLGQLRREGLGGMLTPLLQQRMDDVAAQRAKEANGEPLKMVSFSTGGGSDPSKVPTMYREIADYYQTPRGYHPNAATGYIFTNLSKLFNFTALDYVELISPRPTLFIVGSIADSRYFSDNAYAKALEPKELFEVPGATHIDMYDKPQYTAPAVQQLAAFFGTHFQ